MHEDIGQANAAILRARAKKAESRPRSDRSIILACLIAADCELRRSARIGGPRSVRSALDDRSADVGSSDEYVRFALDHVEAVRRIPDDQVRRVVALASETREGCRVKYRQRDLERELGVPRTTVRRMLDRGLAIVAVELDRLYEERLAA